MKKYTVYGNCQARVLPSVLGSSKEFKAKYEYIDTPAVHRMKSDNLDVFIKDVVPELDVFIYQPISNSFGDDPRYSTRFILSKLKRDCISISFPSCFFRGYNPELDYLRNERNAHITDVFDYHDRNIALEFLKQIEGKAIDPKTFDIKYTPKMSISAVNNSLKELERREDSIMGTTQSMDVKISNFIRKNYRKNRLFYTINHPTTDIFKFIGYQILNLLSIEDIILFRKDPLSHTEYPISPSHSKNLRLEFEHMSEYKINNDCFPPEIMRQKYFDYYKTLPKDVIEQNVLQWLLT